MLAIFVRSSRPANPLSVRMFLRHALSILLVALVGRVLLDISLLTLFGEIFGRTGFCIAR